MALSQIGFRSLILIHLCFDVVHSRFPERKFPKGKSQRGLLRDACLPACLSINRLVFVFIISSSSTLPEPEGFFPLPSFKKFTRDRTWVWRIVSFCSLLSELPLRRRWSWLLLKPLVLHFGERSKKTCRRRIRFQALELRFVKGLDQDRRGLDPT